MNNSRKILWVMCLGAGLGVCLPLSLHAQLMQDFKLPPSKCCLTSSVNQLALQMQDWNQLGRYHDDDVRLKSGPDMPGRVVFLGDSITDGWALARFFPGKPYVNRGIGGQITTQMLVRMYPDVIDLHPAAMIILAGTNDIAGNDGPESIEMIEENFRAMCELAMAHHIKVVLCLLTPISDYAKAPMTIKRPPADILKLNDWLKTYSHEIHAEVADYYSATVDSDGFLRRGYSEDGLHPNAQGYALMVPVAEAAIERALK
jgi:lysophospholipase L1-like esterase